MILRLRTQDNLSELMQAGKIEVAGSVNRESLEKITHVGIYSTEGNLCLQAEFDSANSQCIKNNNEQERLVVAFTNPRIVSTTYQWKDEKSVILLEDTEPTQTQTQENSLKLRAYPIQEQRLAAVLHPYNTEKQKGKVRQGELKEAINRYNCAPFVSQLTKELNIPEADDFEKVEGMSIGEYHVILTPTNLYVLTKCNRNFAKKLGIEQIKGEALWIFVCVVPEGYSLERFLGHDNENFYLNFLTKKDGKIGITSCHLDTMNVGNILPHIYDDIQMPYNRQFREKFSFLSGVLLCLKYKGKWGLIGKYARLILPYQYDEIQVLKGYADSYSVFLIFKLNGKCGIGVIREYYLYEEIAMPIYDDIIFKKYNYDLFLIKLNNLLGFVIIEHGIDIIEPACQPNEYSFIVYEYDDKSFQEYSQVIFETIFEKSWRRKGLSAIKFNTKNRVEITNLKGRKTFSCEEGNTQTIMYKVKDRIVLAKCKNDFVLSDFNADKELVMRGYDDVKVLSHIHESLIVVEKDIFLGVVDFSGKEILPCRFDEIEFEREYIKAQLEGKWGLYSLEGKEILPCRFDEIEFEREYIKAQLEGKWGLYSFEGKEILPCRFDNIWIYSNFIKLRLDGKWGLYNLEGKEIVPCRYDEIVNISIENNFIVVKLDGKRGGYNLEGKEIVPCRYDEIYKSDDFISVQHNGKWGLCSLEGKEIVPCKFDKIKYTEYCIYVKLNGKEGAYSLEGKEILPCRFDYIYAYQEFIEAKLEGKYGAYSLEGKEILPCRFDDINPCGEFIKAKLEGKWGLYSFEVKEIVPCRFDDISTYSKFIIAKLADKYAIYDYEGKELVPLNGKYENIDNEIIRAKFNKKGVLFNMKGEEILRYEYDDIQISFSNKKFVPVKKGKNWGLVDENGKEYLSFKYKDIKDLWNDSLAIVKEDKYGIIEITSQEYVVPCNFDDITCFIANFFLVIKENKYGVFDASGKEVVPCEYEHIEIRPIKETNKYRVDKETNKYRVDLIKGDRYLLGEIEDSNLTIHALHNYEI
ncbi:MAG: WG repeat-containing protein [Candidatus Calescibacterium sp.]|nr:WG repeat-containing protein [Candidatus Calescibacterium sp.]